ncbi:FKBP-type peptidyl-prolyl cis-trans isomerase N-terminal domain-containing protein [Legionella oakridgensis]|uniref:Peptidyl-prolyl cis-trans isomerase n=2 Tax=Legionella oakridgensis TaxID=29423 RepID=W0BA89_9GAMM|nr:FKBP-type peptidyl-prolyl cis-trans isomerase N-terminal domain-containing protein [Legionella oakridgensis]STY19876.1 macrophage infectivity potentiator (Mip) [Legionella longbeachae]AAC45700.1 macrophage infectivity potentiator [Legionella oakridgensis]AHE66750.1 FKBP-type peptidyl-prolyl cis-trans isomerases 1 [Legionella oakridgensis ATCC 33761 = DSM 21215]ETO93546.1 FKBP-type peptidyl-prolyl cis-trans isomerase 1 [Legionella oakridgensis RV-2-2007]KTD38115.1 macrophage infectivity pote
MKLKLVAAAVMGLAMSTAMAATDASSLTTDTDKLSYSIGIDLGKNFKRQGIEINPQAMVQGLQDGISGNKQQLTEEQMKDVLTKFQRDLMTKRTAEYNKKAEDNKKKGEEFLEQNKSKEGVVTLPSGLQYKILKAGDGQKPVKEDTVTVEYTGRLINGEVFDSTEKNGKPASFKLSQVIPGWTEALQLMPAGSVWEVYVPSDLAYGSRSVGGPIGPNETLIFKIHLISVKKSDA